MSYILGSALNIHINLGAAI